MGAHKIWCKRAQTRRGRLDAFSRSENRTASSNSNLLSSKESRNHPSRHVLGRLLGTSIKFLAKIRSIWVTFIRIFNMLFLSIQIILASVTTALLLDLNITKLPSGPSNSATPALSALPNPFQVPDSSIALDFYDHNAGPIFSQAAITSVIDRARQDIVAEMARKGDTRIPWGTHRSKWGVLAFVYESTPPNRVMTYSDVLVALRGLAAKQRVDGN
ncbi:MAG: hypothetical protein Q9174_002260, partial [Haloplaca sp. 1 TL-2023]